MPRSIAQFYVSPSGNDAGAGTLTDPWKTLDGARLKIQPMLDGSGNITVFLRGGTYNLKNTVVFGTVDSGTATQVVTYRAFPGETPVITSLVPVTGWSPCPDDPNIMMAPLPAAVTSGRVRYLQDASENWMPRSATTAFRVEEDADPIDTNCVECHWDLPSTQPDRLDMQYPATFTPPDTEDSIETQYDLRQTILGWNMEILPIANIDTTTTVRRIFTTVPACFDMRHDPAEPEPTAWILNSLDGIDDDGEWACLDDTIYLLPSSGTGDISVPCLTELVRVDEGTADGNAAPAGSPVSHLVFDGLTFTGGDFYTMVPTGVDRGAEVTSQHDWAVVDKPDALLRLRNVSNISVRNCTFSKSGGTGLRVDRHGQNIVVENNVFQYLGRNGACFIGRGPGYGDVNRNNNIGNNHFERTGMEKWAAPALLLDQSSNNRVHHNYFANTDFTSMAVVGPRQIMLASYAESPTVGDYLGREFHYYQVAPSVVSFIQSGPMDDWLDATEPAMQFIYNYNNVIEENAFIDVCDGRSVFFNGKACYISGTKKGQKNSFNYNYIYDSFDHSHNDYAWYNDFDQDACDCIGNMIHSVQSGGSQPEPFPLIQATAGWAETLPGTPTASIVLNATAILNCTYSVRTRGGAITEDGTIEQAAIPGAPVGGSATYVTDYQKMWSVLCPGNIANATLQGAPAMQTMLAVKIDEFDESVPTCVFPAITIRSVSRAGSTLTVEFAGPAFYTGWNVKGSPDLVTFTDVTASSTITETGRGIYQADIVVDGTPDLYFVRVEE